MTKKELLKKLSTYRDDAEIIVIDSNSNEMELIKVASSGLDAMLIVENVDEDYDDYEDEDDYDDEDAEEED